MDSVTRSEIRTRVLDRVNMASSSFVTETELNTEIDQSAKELWDKLIIARGQDYLVNYGGFSTVNGTGGYSLETDFYQMLAVQVTYNGDQYPLKKFTWQDEWKYFGSRIVGVTPPQWRWRTNSYVASTPFLDRIEIRPIPTTVNAITYMYIPNVISYTSGGAEPTTTYNWVNGFEDYMVARVARYCLAKEESDTSFWDQEILRIEARIQTMAGQRDAGDPERIRDASDIAYDDPYAELRRRWG